MVIKRTVSDPKNEFKTSISMEIEFYDEFKRIAKVMGLSQYQLLNVIRTKHRHGECKNLSSKIRVFILDYVKQEKMNGQV